MSRKGRKRMKGWPMPEGRTPQNPRFPDGAVALTFDDVLIRPAASNVLPNEANVASRVTRSIALHIPVISSAMDTVTEAYTLSLHDALPI